MHQSFKNIRDLDGKILGTSETLVSYAYTSCLCIGCVYIEVYVVWLCIGPICMWVV
jgi:hypothetical protein